MRGIVTITKDFIQSKISKKDKNQGNQYTSKTRSLPYNH